jgi:hypothetical protein
MDFMFACARFLGYPNLAGNSVFRRFGCREKASKGALFDAGIGLFRPQKRL